MCVVCNLQQRSKQQKRLGKLRMGKRQNVSSSITQRQLLGWQEQQRQQQQDLEQQQLLPLPLRQTSCKLMVMLVLVLQTLCVIAAAAMANPSGA